MRKHRFKKMWRDNHGDVYIPLMISMCILAVAFVVAVSIGSAMNTKMWLDEKLNDVAKVVSSNGTIQNERITELEEEIVERLGGSISYEGTFLIPNGVGSYEVFTGTIPASDAREICVQLNDVVYVVYHNDQYAAIHIGDFVMHTDINLRSMAVSNVYYKRVTGMTD